MKRIKKLVAVAVVAVALLMAAPSPASAHSGGCGTSRYPWIKVSTIIYGNFTSYKWCNVSTGSCHWDHCS